MHKWTRFVQRIANSYEHSVFGSFQIDCLRINTEIISLLSKLQKSPNEQCTLKILLNVIHNRIFKKLDAASAIHNLNSVKAYEQGRHCLQSICYRKDAQT